MTASVSTSSSTLKWKILFNNGSVTGDDYGTNLMIGTDGDVYAIGTTYINAINGTDGIVIRYNVSNGTIGGFVFLNQATNDTGEQIGNGPAGYLFAACLHSTTINVYKIQIAATLIVNTSASYVPFPASPNTGILGVVISDMKVAASNNVYVGGSVNASSANGPFSASYLTKVGVSGPVFTVLNSQTVEGDFYNNYFLSSMSLDPAHNNIRYRSEIRSGVQPKEHLPFLVCGFIVREPNQYERK